MDAWYSEMVALLIGALGGGAISAAITVKFIKSQRLSGSGQIINQGRVKAGRDNAGRDILKND